MFPKPCHLVTQSRVLGLLSGPGTMTSIQAYYGVVYACPWPHLKPLTSPASFYNLRSVLVPVEGIQTDAPPRPQESLEGTPKGIK